MKKFLKWAVIVFIILVVIGNIFGNGNDTEEEVAIEGDKIDYEIAEIEEVHAAAGEVKRYTYHVVINEEGGIEELKEISKEVVKQAKADTDFNALVIGFYDYEEYINSGYVLGKAEYVPYGEFSKAMDVETGEYENFEFVWDLREKNWEAQPTPEEVEIWKEFDDLLWEDPDMDEDTIKEMVAEDFNITIEEVEEILQKNRIWR